MNTHRKDLKRSSFGSEDDARVTIVHDGELVPILHTIYINGQEVLLPEGGEIGISFADKDLTKVTLTFLPTSIEIVSEEEVEARAY